MSRAREEDLKNQLRDAKFARDSLLTALTNLTGAIGPATIYGQTSGPRLLPLPRPPAAAHDGEGSSVPLAPVVQSVPPPSDGRQDGAGSSTASAWCSDYY